MAGAGSVRVANKATDVYAFGVTMYECFTVPYDIPYKDWKGNKVGFGKFPALLLETHVFEGVR